MNRERDRCIALAGLFQSAELASQVARRGIADTEAMEASIHSLFQIDAPTVTAVYGDLAGISCGLKVIANQLGGHGSRSIEVTRYTIALLHLERKLAKQPAMLEEIGNRIQQTTMRREHFHLLHPNILAGLAEIYADTISHLRPRILVHGDPLHLQNGDNVNRVRALLLAGIRSAMLWRQCGGNRLQLLLGRRRIYQLSQDLLRQTQAE